MSPSFSAFRRQRRPRAAFLLPLLALVLASCTPPPGAAPVGSAKPTSTLVQAAATASPAPSATPTVAGPTPVPELPTVPPSATPPPTPSPTPPPTPTATHPRTATPTVPPTPSVTPSSTPCQPPQVSFTMDDPVIKAKGCTHLRWDVQFATAVYLDGEGVPGTGSKEVCLAETRTYTLHVDSPCGGMDRSITIEVIIPPSPTPDTAGPAAPATLSPTGGLVLSCRSTVGLKWSPSTDPSGIAGYYVKLQIQQTADTWVNVRSWGPLNVNGIEANVQCGGIYRFSVRARDGAGNDGPWAPWAHFSIILS